MRFFRAVRMLILLASSILAVACNGATETLTPDRPSVGVTASPLPPRPTASLLLSGTVPPPLNTDTLTPIAPAIATATDIPCDSTTGYCVEVGHFLLERPIALPGTITIDPTYLYGSTQNGTRQPHHGVEFYDASGTPVLAAADGVVIVAGDDKGSPPYSPWLNFYGSLIVLEHHLPDLNQPLFTLYGHLSKIEVQTGQHVRAGEKIGEAGASGEATGSHLHFEVRLGENDYDSNRNPVLWLKPLSYEDGNPSGVVAGCFVDGKGDPLYYTGLNIQYFPELGGPQAAVYPVETYAPEDRPVHADDKWQENFALGDLPTGHYRISFILASVLYERWVEVKPGKLTVVTFIVE
ncbi:MAG: M23 family metallopeptidase, partial [Anaerolineales bacterium]|nr:M23 family metallopeptidase [Anaerolineales bacterium]